MFYNKQIWSCKANILQRKTYLILQTNICDTIKQTYVMFYIKYMWWIKEAYVMWCYKTNICDVLRQTYMTCSKINTWCYAAKETRVVQQKRQARHILSRREIEGVVFLANKLNLHHSVSPWVNSSVSCKYEYLFTVISQLTKHLNWEYRSLFIKFPRRTKKTIPTRYLSPCLSPSLSWKRDWGERDRERKGGGGNERTNEQCYMNWHA